MSEADRMILSLLLSERREWRGLELIESSEGVLRRGTVYVYLSRLEDAGYVSRRFEIRTGRNFYKITERGITRLHDALAAQPYVPGQV